jgi:transcriptional regulator with XRE-family HTH domain
MFLMSDRERFSKWLQAEMSYRNWTQADLARNSGLHRAIISKLVLGSSTPLPDTLLAIAAAFKMPEAQVFEEAGILPKKSAKDRLLAILENIFDSLPEDEKDNVLEFAKHRQVLSEKKNEKKRTNKVAGIRK